jgi:small ligand-binding sensory domain FIST
MVRAGAGVSADPDPLAAGAAAGDAAASRLEGDSADLVLVFASGSHLAAPESTLEGVRGALGAGTLVGCGAGGVLATGRELESGSAVAVWAASLDVEGEATPFHARVVEEDGEHRLRGLPALDDARGMILLSDPYTFPTDPVLGGLAERAPGMPVLGGLASGRLNEQAGALFYGDQLCTDGAVGVVLRGVELLPCVSQGAAPLGPEATITAAEGNLIHELAGQPALTRIEQIIESLAPRERALVAAGLLIGLVIDGGKPDYGQGDFLVRGILGADRESGAVAVGATVREGQVVRLHARDAPSADEDLRRALRVRMEALAPDAPAGALVFSCNGRGEAMFGERDHDAAMIERELGGAPAAGFFAAGEIGPVGGRSFVHGFTATVAVFAS